MSHIHCTKCGEVIKKAGIYSTYNRFDEEYYKNKICKDCVINAGLAFFKRCNGEMG